MDLVTFSFWMLRPRERWRHPLIKIHILMISVSLLLFCVVAYLEKGTPAAQGTSKIIPTEHIPEKFTPNDENPPITRVDGARQMYVMVLDSSFRPEKYHCVAYEQWMRPLTVTGVPEAIEFYSLNSWHNEDCNISSITVSVDASRAGTSSQFLYKSLNLYVTRSEAPWLFLVGDATFIHTSRFLEAIGHYLERTNPWVSFAMGNCVERRFYFQMFPISSGILISRRTVMLLLSKTEMWDVAIQIGLPADEALSQILDAVSVTVRSHHRPEFLGMPFRNISHYEVLLNRNFAGLKPCAIPQSIMNARSGVSTICSSDIFPIRDIATWAGAPDDTSASKLQFLLTAEKMLDEVPNNIRFYWDRLYPTLCDTFVS